VGKLDGKSVIVTGAARGIGTAIVRACVDEGAQVVAVDIDPAVEEVAASVGAAGVVGDEQPGTHRFSARHQPELIGALGRSGRQARAAQNQPAGATPQQLRR